MDKYKFSNELIQGSILVFLILKSFLTHNLESLDLVLTLIAVAYNFIYNIME